jgi:hypothetical protein
MAAPRLGRPSKKRTHEEAIDFDGSDDDYQPDQTAIRPASAPVTNKQPAQYTVTKAQYDRLSLLQRVPKVYQSQNGHSYFSKDWFKEVAKNDGFWLDFMSKVPASIQKRYIVDAVISALGQPKLIVTSNKPRSEPKAPRVPQSAAASTEVTQPVAQCELCKHPLQTGETCYVCLARQDEDDEEIVVSKKGKATSKLSSQYFVGDESNPIKVEDDLPKDEEKPIKLEHMPQFKKEDSQPKLITLDDGTQLLSYNGKLRVVTASTPVKVEI